jgi:hypothetical protein
VHGEFAEIAAVGFERVRGSTALRAHHFQKGFEMMEAG